jgi:hypothetical protein
MHNVLWKRLDSPGHDACRFTKLPEGWMIQGAAVFDHDGQPAHLMYRLICDPDWISQHASVTGWVGDRTLEISIQRQRGGHWSVNGSVDEALGGLLDIDFGFTPASNTNALRRLDLKPEEEVATVFVWLDTESWTMRPLPQTYRRLRADAYDYASPQHGYRATLLVDEIGTVTSYPGLWKQVLP